MLRSTVLWDEEDADRRDATAASDPLFLRLTPMSLMARLAEAYGYHDLQRRLMRPEEIIRMANFFLESRGSAAGDQSQLGPPSADFEPLIVALASMLTARSLGSLFKILAFATSSVEILYTRDSRRTVFRVAGHMCIDMAYCSCSAFAFLVAKGETQHCKHLFALAVLQGFVPRFRVPAVFPSELLSRLAAERIQPDYSSTAGSSAQMIRMSPNITSASRTLKRPSRAQSFVDDDGFTWTEVTETDMAFILQSKPT